MKSLGSRYNQHSFAQIPQANISRSKFDRSFSAKDTMNFDELTPIFIDEILPGDTANVSMKSFARLATQAVPVMDNMYIDVFFFFVPNRLVWNNWERFNGAQDNPNDSTDFLIPTITAPSGGFVNGSIYDHLGIPTQVENIEINALPLRAYNLIYNDWYRDQNLINSLPVPKNDGPDTHSNYALQKRAKKHDYFTSCLPWPQKGAAITMPLGGMAPVYGNENSPSLYSGNNWYSARTVGRLTQNNVDDRLSLLNGAAGNISNIGLASKAEYSSDHTALPPYADLSEATAATINSLRQAFMMQSLLELDARGGTRYVEILKSHFNVVSPDFRLQRPEFLSSGTITINQHPVTQTSESGTTPMGTLAAFSTASQTGNNIGFSKSFVEHGYIIGVAQARADITYQQGLHKMWTRQTRWDFFWPKLQEVGEQAVLRKEIEATGTPTDEEVFGYQERNAEYKFKPSEIRGQFRSNYAESLDVWHLAQEFATQPLLNKSFIESSTPIERVLTVAQGYPHLIVDMWFEYKHARPMVTHAIPATLGRF